MRIAYSHQGREKIFDRGAAQVLIGRSADGVVVDLDLRPDWTVSPLHARLWFEDGQYWIEDLGSERGTQINDEEIKDQGKRPLGMVDIVKIGETELRIQAPPVTLDSSGKPSSKEASQHILEITPSLDASKAAFTAGDVANLDSVRQRLTLFYELPLQFGEETRLDALLQLIVGRVISVIPGAERGAVLVKDKNGKLALKAHLPVGRPAVSLTMAQRAMDQRSAFIWPPISLSKQTIPDSVGVYRIESAMYAPLLWRGQTFGAVCVDNDTGGGFSADDLRLLQAVAHHAAMAVANLELHEERQQQMEVLNNMLKLVSPQIGERLKQRGQVRLGGEFREVTILLADIRGFTNLSATMSPHDVTQMLEDYFGCLVPVIFKHQGTIDKFVGDAILAVFGSPDADEQQHLHAIQSALDMQAAMKEVNTKRAANDKRTGELGIGIHYGEVVHGLIGTAERMEYTVIGDTVNRASRYCDGADGGEVLISSELYQWVWNLVEAEQTIIATKHEGNLTAYRIKGLREYHPRT
jgi:adenylate cyclase